MADVLKMHSAIRWGKPIDELKAAGLASGKEANMQDPENGNSAIHIAVQNGHKDIARWLVKDLKCDVNIQNKSGNTALHMGVEYDYYAINQLLMDGGTKTDLTNNEGHKAITGLAGEKVGPDAWDNPVTMLKGIDDTVASLEEVFKKLEIAKPEDIRKEELVKTGMMKKRELKAWAEGGFQARFTDVVKKL